MADIGWALTAPKTKSCLIFSFPNHLKLKMNLREKVLLKEVVLQGIVSIQMEEAPMVIEEKLLAYLKFHSHDYKISQKLHSGAYRYK